jgi:formate/nitrite transporter FocA (FNT family)
VHPVLFFLAGLLGLGLLGAWRSKRRERFFVAAGGGLLFGFGATVISIATGFQGIDTHSVLVTLSWTVGVVTFYRHANRLIYCWFGESTRGERR